MLVRYLPNHHTFINIPIFQYISQNVPFYFGINNKSMHNFVKIMICSCFSKAIVYILKFIILSRPDFEIVKSYGRLSSYKNAKPELLEIKKSALAPLNETYIFYQKKI